MLSDNSTNPTAKLVLGPIIETNPRKLYFDIEDDSVKTFWIKNVGDTTLFWSIRKRLGLLQNIPDWVCFHPDTGHVMPNDSTQVNTAINRNIMQYPDYGEISRYVRINVNYRTDRGVVVVVKFIHPIIGFWDLHEIIKNSEIVSGVWGYQIYSTDRTGPFLSSNDYFESRIHKNNHGALVKSGYALPSSIEGSLIFTHHSVKDYNGEGWGMLFGGHFEYKVNFDESSFYDYVQLALGVMGTRFSINQDTLSLFDDDTLIRYVKE